MGKPLREENLCPLKHLTGWLAQVPECLPVVVLRPAVDLAPQVLHRLRLASVVDFPLQPP